MESENRLLMLGRLLWGTGLALVALRGIELFTRMPGLPAFWYANQPLWIMVGLGMAAMGWQLLWGQASSMPQFWQPTIPGRRFKTATLYTRKDCHLCDDAIAILAKYHQWIPLANEVDIDADATLTERFCNCVPVVMLDHKIRFRGKINETLLRRLIEGTPPVNATNPI